jgi:hypothetical protein
MSIRGRIQALERMRGPELPTPIDTPAVNT